MISKHCQPSLPSPGLEFWDMRTRVTTSFPPFPDGIGRVMNAQLVQTLFYSHERQASFLISPFLILWGTLELECLTYSAQLRHSTCWSFPGTKFKETIEEHMVFHTQLELRHTLPRIPAAGLPESSLPWPFHRPESKEGLSLERSLGFYRLMFILFPHTLFNTAGKSAQWEHIWTLNFIMHLCVMLKFSFNSCPNFSDL